MICLPTGHQAGRAVRKVGLNLLMQLAEVVARHRGVHVVFRVVVHLPVQEAEERIQQDGPAAKPVIRHLILEPGVLGVVAQPLQPAAVERRQRDHDRHQPQAEGERDDDDQGLPQELDARPGEQAAAQFHGRFGEKGVLPVTFQPAETEPDAALQPAEEVPRVHHGVLEEGPEGELDRQHHFEVSRGVERVFVVLLVARPEHHGVVPTQEADHVKEERVQGLRFEDRFVAELVEPVEEKRPEGAMQEKNQQQHGKRKPSGGEEGGCSLSRRAAPDDRGFGSVPSNRCADSAKPALHDRPAICTRQSAGLEA